MMHWSTELSGMQFDPAMLGDLGLLNLPVPELPGPRLFGQPYGPRSKPQRRREHLRLDLYPVAQDRGTAQASAA